MLGVSPCPDGGCTECRSAVGHYHTCSQNPAFSSLKVSKEDLECAARIESAEKRITGFVRNERVH